MVKPPTQKKVGKTVALSANATPNAGCFPSGCCGPTVSCHPQVASLQKSDDADPEEYLPCPGSWLSRCQWCRTPEFGCRKEGNKLRGSLSENMSRLHVERNGLTRQCLDEDLHSTTQTQHHMQGAFLLDVVRFPPATRARPRQSIGNSQSCRVYCASPSDSHGQGPRR